MIDRKKDKISKCGVCEKMRYAGKTKKLEDGAFVTACPECSKDLDKTLMLLKTSTDCLLEKDQTYRRIPGRLAVTRYDD
jgi:hypothetical protein